MKVTPENTKNLPIDITEQALLEALLIDLDEINSKSKVKLFIDWQDYHNDYSPERTDPCPDYYGTYTIRPEINPYEIIGVEMDIDALDNAIYLLCNFIDYYEKEVES